MRIFEDIIDNHRIIDNSQKTSDSLFENDELFNPFEHPESFDILMNFLCVGKKFENSYDFADNIRKKLYSYFESVSFITKFSKVVIDTPVHYFDVKEPEDVTHCQMGRKMDTTMSVAFKFDFHNLREIVSFIDQVPRICTEEHTFVTGAVHIFKKETDGSWSKDGQFLYYNKDLRFETPDNWYIKSKFKHRVDFDDVSDLTKLIFFVEPDNGLRIYEQLKRAYSPDIRNFYENMFVESFIGVKETKDVLVGNLVSEMYKMHLNLNKLIDTYKHEDSSFYLIELNKFYKRLRIEGKLQLTGDVQWRDNVTDVRDQLLNEFGYKQFDYFCFKFFKVEDEDEIKMFIHLGTTQVRCFEYPCEVFWVSNYINREKLDKFIEKFKNMFDERVDERILEQIRRVFYKR